MIAVIDYDAGNIKSVEKALLSLGQSAVITREPEDILKADGVVLPGVGAFGDGDTQVCGTEQAFSGNMSGTADLV